MKSQTGPFDWLVTLLRWLYEFSDWRADFPTFEDFLADVRLLDYDPSCYLGAVLVYHSRHYCNEYSNRDWEAIGHKMGDGCRPPDPIPQIGDFVASKIARFICGYIVGFAAPAALPLLRGAMVRLGNGSEIWLAIGDLQLIASAITEEDLTDSEDSTHE